MFSKYCAATLLTMWCALRLLQEKPAKGRLFHSQKNLAELEERCEHPWRDLFLWAVLQNRQQMANYFWAMVSLFSFFRQFSPRLVACQHLRFCQKRSKCAWHWQKPLKPKGIELNYTVLVCILDSVDKSDVGQHTAGAGESCHMKMSL